MMLQRMGDAIRNGLNKDFFVWLMEGRIKQIADMSYSPGYASDVLVLITDVRFQNEIKLVERLGGQIVQIDRPCARPKGLDDPKFDVNTLHISERDWWATPETAKDRWFVMNSDDDPTRPHDIAVALVDFLTDAVESDGIKFKIVSTKVDAQMALIPSEDIVVG